MAAQSYTTIKQAVALALTQQVGTDLGTFNALFEAEFPQAASYAENRIYRRLVMLAQRRTDTSLQTSSGIRSLGFFLMPSQQILVPEGFALLSPAGTQVPFDEASLDVIDLVWPTETATLDPAVADPAIRLWAMQNDDTLVFCPTADGAYTAAITGLFMPETVSQTNPVTYLTINYPELLEAGCLVYLTGALTRNFGAQGDDSRQAMSWESQFRDLLDAANDEECRRRGLSPNIAKTSQGAPQKDASPTSPA